MASVSLGNQKFIGNSNFPIAMVTGLLTQLTGKNVTASHSGNVVVISQGGTELVRFDLSTTGREVWATILDVLMAGATVSDIGVADRIQYSAGYSAGIDWRDMAQSTTINDDRFVDAALTVSVNNAAFTIDGFGNHFQKVVGLRLQRNDGNANTGAMMEVGLGRAFLRVNTSNQIEINTALNLGAGNESWSPLLAAPTSTPITLANSNNNYLIFEMVELIPGQTDQYELIGAFFDGANYFAIDNLTFNRGTVDGDNLGFSRSATQRGQVVEFKAIDSSGYLRHSQLDTNLRQHRDDRWVYGYARLISGSTERGVALATRLNLAAGSQVAGVELTPRLSPVTVHQATGTGTASGELVASVALPVDYTDYDFVHVTERVAGEPAEWRHTTISTHLLNSGNIQSTDNIRIQGNSDMAWVSGTREIAIVGALQQIYRVMLVDV